MLVCILLAGCLDMMTMGALLPMIGSLGGTEVASTSKLNDIAVKTIQYIGVEPVLTNFLILGATTLVGKSLLALAAMTYVAHSCAVIQARIRRDIVAAVLNARWSYFVDLPPGQTTNAVTGQAILSGEAYYSTSMVIVSTIQALALALAASLVSGYMVLVTVVAAVVLSLPLYKIIKYARKSGEAQWQRAGELGARVQDAVSNMKAIKSMNQGGVFREVFRDLIDEMRKAYFAVLLSRHTLSYGQDTMLAITVALGVYVGAVVAKLPLADIAVLGFIYAQVITYVKKIQQHAQIAAVNQEAYFSLLDILEDAAGKPERTSGTRRIRMREQCSLENVDFAYGETKILHGVSLEIPFGETTVLLGPSGAGKTTIIDMLTGLLVPSEGKVRVDGVPLEELDIADWRGGIGYVPQELTLLHGSVLDNVTLRDPSISQEEVWAALEQSGASDFVRSLPNQLQEEIGNMGSRLSGGQRQRLSLARALVRKPNLLILDEVTSALDEDTEAEICNNIADLEKNYAIVVITHRPRWKDIASRLYRVDNGRCTREAEG